MSFKLADFVLTHHISGAKIAVGVSGGSDSLALVLAAHEELSPLGFQIIALTVDHQLREASHQEAVYVEKIMRQKGIEHHILVWQGDKPRTGIEEEARKARYHLLENWCAGHDCQYLMLAHHQEDQAETFFMRLQRGSGLDGLCGMRPVTKRGLLTLLRPLLSVSKKDLQSFLLQKGCDWVEDETNYSDDFLRCRIRKFLPHFCEKTSIEIANIAETMLRLQSSQRFLQDYTEKVKQKFFQVYSQAGYSCRIADWKNFDDEIRFRLLGVILKELSQMIYIPRAKRIVSLLKKLKQPNFKSATLGGCEILLAHDRLWIVKQVDSTLPYTRKQWEDFVMANPVYKKKNVPFKLRRVLVNQGFQSMHSECAESLKAV